MAVIQTRQKSYSYIKPDEYYQLQDEIISQLNDEELDALVALIGEDFSEAFRYQSFELDRPILPVMEWLEDPYHMGEVSKSLFREWKEDLRDMFESKLYLSALLQGGMGIGKSTVAQFAMMRMLYEASCLKDPALSYGLSSGTRLYIVNLAPTENTARRAVFSQMYEKIKKVPYFREEFPFLNKERERFVSNVLEFKKNLVMISGSSSDNSFIGLDVIGGFVDELNFFQKLAQTKRKSVTQEDRYGEDSKAGNLFDSLFRRIKTRFLKYGQLPGLLIGASSKLTSDSLTERMIRDAISTKDRSIFVRDRSILDLKRNQFSRNIFKVFVGDDQRRPKILTVEEHELYDEEYLLDVPEDLRRDFENDLDRSLTDFGGVSASAMSVFFGDFEKVNACIDKDRVHPFRCLVMPNIGEWDSTSAYSIDWYKLAKIQEDGSWAPLRNPGYPRVAHLDPGVTGDAFGLTILHVCGFYELKRKSEHGEPIIDRLPVYDVDFMLRIEGNKTEPVQFRNIRKIIYDFSEHGFHFSNISMDTFQTVEMIQALKQQGFSTSILSVDESKDPYRYFRSIVNDGRLKMYKYQAVLDEIFKLEEHPKMIDHPLGFRKDCADSLCGAIYNAFLQGHMGNPLPMLKGESVGMDKLKEEEEKENNILKKLEMDHSKYKKREILQPKYVKSNNDGSETDMRKDNSYRDNGNFIVEIY